MNICCTKNRKLKGEKSRKISDGYKNEYEPGYRRSKNEKKKVIKINRKSEKSCEEN